MRHDLKKGYKVVQVYQNKLFSYNGYPSADTIKHGQHVEYAEGHTTNPKRRCGPLAIYTKKSSAVKMLRENDNDGVVYHIYNCLYAPSRKKSVFLQRFDGMAAHICDGRMIDCLPKHTVLASAVILLNRV